jgi:hypothetical protein
VWFIELLMKLWCELSGKDNARPSLDDSEDEEDEDEEDEEDDEAPEQ